MLGSIKKWRSFKMAALKIRFVLFQNNRLRYNFWHKYGIRHICIYTTSFVYISDVKVRLGAIWYGIIRSSALFVYVLRHLFTYQSKGGLGAKQSGIIRSSAIFVYMLRHLFTYQRLKLG